MIVLLLLFSCGWLQGCGAADGFWDHNSFETELDQDEYLDPELWDPDEDPVPDMAAEINENIFECL